MRIIFSLSLGAMTFFYLPVMAGNQRANLDYLHQQLAPTSSIANDYYLAKYLKFSGNLNIDLGLANTLKMDPWTGKNDPAGIFFPINSTPSGAKNKINLANSWFDVDVFPSHWLMGHVEIAGNNSNYTANSLASANHTWDINFLRLNEAYATVGDLRWSPFYVTVGRKYINFGHYEDPHTVLNSLTQDLTEINATEIEAGYLQPQGFYLDGYAFRGLLKRSNGATSKNVGVDAGYEWQDDNNHNGYNLGISWIYNMADVLAVYPIVVFNHSTVVANTVTNALRTFNSTVDGVAVGLNGQWQDYDAKIEWVSALCPFSVNDVTFQGHGAKPSAGLLSVGYQFQAMQLSQHVGIGYQLSRQASSLGLPRQRYLMDWKIQVLPQADLIMTYARDKNYSLGDGGTSKSSQAFITRLSIHF
ncbi:MAG: LbtU family siderophore porin [Legionellales bacterium]|nr:LbtU family siderophore porin [Legionellales bacterium]